MTYEQTTVPPGWLWNETLKLYEAGGYPVGAKTGYRELDPLYSINLGEWTVVTGNPGCGKSEFLDAVMVNLAEADPGWQFAIYSPENVPVAGHFAKLCEKRARLPFTPGAHPRMNRGQLGEAGRWVNDHFIWLDTKLKTPDELLARALSLSGMVKLGVVLDPWNTLEHLRGGMSETDYVSFILAEVTKLARESAKAHVWIVAHPTKIQRNKDGTRPVPTPYDISGSSHWYNKADCILTVHREQNPEVPTQEVEIHVQKIRHKWTGHIGLARVFYDKVTGRYFDPPEQVVAGVTYTDPQRSAVPPLERQPGEDVERAKPFVYAVPDDEPVQPDERAGAMLLALAHDRRRGLVQPEPPPPEAA